MKQDRKLLEDIIYPIIMPVSLGVVFVAAYFAYTRLPNDAGIIFVVITIIFCGLAYSFLRYQFRKKWKARQQNIIMAIDAVRMGNELDEKNNAELLSGYLAAADTEFSMGLSVRGLNMQLVYDALEALSQSLRKKEKNRSELLNMVNSVAANMELEKLLEALMPKLLESSQSNWGVFYLANNATNKLEIKSSIGFSKNIFAEFDITIGEGFIGEVALSGEIKIVKDIPDDTIYIAKTFLGVVKPKNLMLVPIISQDQLMGVLALGSIYEYTNEQMEIVDLIKYYIGAAVGNGVIYERSKRLTNELTFQNKLIQDLNNELETKINEHNLFLNTIINSMEDYSIYTLDKAGTILTWNDGAEIMHGYSADEVVGKNITIIYSAEDIESGIIKKRIDEAYKNGKYVEKGWRRKRDGTIYYIDVTIFAMYNQKGEMIGITNVSKDITDLKMAQDELMFEKALNNKLFENNRRPGIIVNYNHIIENANIRARELLNDSQLVGKRLSDIFDISHEVDEFISSINIARNHSESAVFELIFKYSNDSINVTIMGIDDDTGHFKKIVVMFEL